MVDLWVQFLCAWWILFPATAANVFPPLFKGRTPVDLGRNLKRHRIFGPGKTFKGAFVGILAGTIVGAAETLLAPSINAYAANFGVVFPTMTFFVGFMIALGAVVGDMAGSFLKRRLNLERGAKVPLLDQLDFVIGAIVFSYFFTEISIYMVLIMVILIPLIHRLACIIGYRLKVKKEPW